MKEKGRHFKTIKEATDAILLMEFNRVVEYRIIYHRPTETESEYWIVKRKIMSYNAFGKAVWTPLEV
jgi:hypothetical protein